MASTPFINWRDGEFSDWTCTLGSAKYFLHKNVLVSGRRSSGFFKGAVNESFEAAGTDLTSLVPTICHAYMELALDFIYGGDVKFTIESALALYKIADVLSIDSLMESSLAAIPTLYEGQPEWLKFALSLELPSPVMDTLLPLTHMGDVLGVSAKRPMEPHVGALLQACARRARVISQQELDLQPGVERRDELSLHLTFPPSSTSTTQRLHKSPIGTTTAFCRVRILRVGGVTSSIGVSKLSADSISAGTTDGGFASKAGCWGLCLHSGELIGENTVVQNTSRNYTDFFGRVVQIHMDRPRGCLKFTLEVGSDDELVGTLTIASSSCGDLVFTVSGTTSSTYAILQMNF